MQRMAARALFGAPPTSTFEEAYKHFLSAEEAEAVSCIDESRGHSGMYTVKLVEVCVQLGRREEAKRWAEIQLARTSNEGDDEKEYNDKAKQLVAKL